MARTVIIDPGDVRAAIEAPLIGLSDAIRGVLHNCPPDLVADLADRGMVLTGGSALLPGLDERLRTGTGMPVHIAEHPALSAVNGLAAMVEGKIRPLGTARSTDRDRCTGPERSGVASEACAEASRPCARRTRRPSTADDMRAAALQYVTEGVRVPPARGTQRRSLRSGRRARSPRRPRSC